MTQEAPIPLEPDDRIGPIYSAAGYTASKKLINTSTVRERKLNEWGIRDRLCSLMIAINEDS